MKPSMPSSEAKELKYSYYMRRDMEKLSSCKAYIGVEVLLHAYVTSALHVVG